LQLSSFGACGFWRYEMHPNISHILLEPIVAMIDKRFSAKPGSCEGYVAQTLSWRMFALYSWKMELGARLTNHIDNQYEIEPYYLR